MTKSATTRRLEGVVIDGAVCDSTWLRRPEPHPGVTAAIRARGTPSAHTTWEIPGSIKVPTVHGGVVGHPGELVAGDDGVVVVARDRIFGLLDPIERFAGEAAYWLAAMDEGRTSVHVLALQGTATDPVIDRTAYSSSDGA